MPPRSSLVGRPSLGRTVRARRRTASVSALRLIWEGEAGVDRRRGKSAIIRRPSLGSPPRRKDRATRRIDDWRITPDQRRLRPDRLAPSQVGFVVLHLVKEPL